MGQNAVKSDFNKQKCFHEMYFNQKGTKILYMQVERSLKGSYYLSYETPGVIKSLHPPTETRQTFLNVCCLEQPKDYIQSSTNIMYRMREMSSFEKEFY